MRILLVHPHDIQVHPWTIRIIQFAECLAARGHETTLAYIASRKPWTGQPEGPARLIRKTRVVALSSLRAGSLDTAEYNLLGKTEHSISSLAKDADIIHFQKANPRTALPALWAAYRRGLHIHYDWDDNETGLIRRSSEPRLMKMLTSQMERWLPRFVDTISVSSQALREKALQLGFPEDRLFDAPVGADIERFRPGLDGSRARELLNLSASERVILWAGQLEAADYADRLLACARQVLAQEPKARFVFLGAGPRLESLKEMIRMDGLTDKVCMAGWIPPEEMPQFLAAADVAVAPLDDDEAARCKSPLKIAEYMAMGLPIVSNRVGEAVTMLDGCGALVPPGDDRAMAEAILTYLHSPLHASRDGTAARLRAESRYNWEWSVDNLEKAYQQEESGKR